jgi:tRNA (guanine-N7-)-methyltransferase
VHEGDAREVIAWLPDGCLDVVYLLYPDPWPKLKHEKRRFMGLIRSSSAPEDEAWCRAARRQRYRCLQGNDAEGGCDAHLGFDRSDRDTTQPWEDWTHAL